MEKDVQRCWRTVESGERSSPLRHDHATKESITARDTSVSKTLKITKEKENEKIN